MRPVFKHLKFLGFLKASQESEMQILFKNCMPDKFAFIAHSKIFTLMDEIEINMVWLDISICMLYVELDPRDQRIIAFGTMIL